jgi:hypothetical protein
MYCLNMRLFFSHPAPDPLQEPDNQQTTPCQQAGQG